MGKDVNIINPDKNEAIQNYYPDDYSHCYGCGRLNKDGLQIKSYWDGNESICCFLPEKQYTGGKKGILYGGLIAALIDCHGAATAAAAKAKELGIEIKKGKMPRFVTASLKVDYLAPTPVNTELELRGKIKEIKGRKVMVEVNLLVEQKVYAKGELLFIQLKEYDTGDPW
ncbi:MAG: PaaI family thioesterase [Syntrophorhabdaceae bacterium]|nr:PaaI family thioesterase [Syntrophorhabdaceae bacterium]